MVDDTIKEQLNSQGDVVESYYCERGTANNVLVDLVIPYYYDLVYPCTEDPSEGRSDVEAALLYRSKEAFLPNAEACTNPRNPWFAKVSSLPEDASAGFGCQELTADTDAGECCTAVKGDMTFTQLSTADPNALKAWVKNELDDPADIAAGYRVKFIGSELSPEFEFATETPTSGGSTSGTEEDDNTTTGRGPDILIPAGNQDAPPPPPPANSNEFTMVGILILIGMIMIFITTIVLIIKQRRRYLKGQDVDAAIAQSELGLHKEEDLVGEHIDTATWGDGTFDEQDLEVQVLSDNPQGVKVRSVSNVSYKTHEGQAAQNSIAREEYLNQQQYNFDLADSYKSNVMGTYGADLFGPTQITVVPPYPMEETSESEVDSWAQTDGTVGSLDDDRLIEDTETGEI